MLNIAFATEPAEGEHNYCPFILVCMSDVDLKKPCALLRVTKSLDSGMEIGGELKTWMIRGHQRREKSFWKLQ